MPAPLRKLTHYFRRALIDSDRISPSDRDVVPLLGVGKTPPPGSPYRALPEDVWQSGQLPEALVSEIRSRQRGITLPEVVLFPRVDLLQSHQTDVDSRRRRILVPLVVFARVSETGALLPSEKAPWIPREWVDPNPGLNPPIAGEDALDGFLTRNPYEGIEAWGDLVDYAVSMLSAGMRNPLFSALHGEPMADEYVQTGKAVIQIDDPPVIGGKESMLKVLSALQELPDADIPPLYASFANPDPAETSAQERRDPSLHVGQMASDHALSPRQRDALSALLASERGAITAVNGPPGTGKTTLIRSVVASLWTQAAVDNAEPPLILATSSNNQAVINILDSFAKAGGPAPAPLQGRWLPEVSSYGLYCCSSARLADTQGLQLFGARGEGCFTSWNTRDFIDRAKAHFSAKATGWLPEEVSGLADIRDALHAQLVERHKLLKSGADLAGVLRRLSKTIESRTAGMPIAEAFAAAKEDSIEAARRCDAVEALRNKIRSDRGFLSPIAKMRSRWELPLDPWPEENARRIRSAFRDMGLSVPDVFEGRTLPDDFVDSWLEDRIAGANDAYQRKHAALKVLGELGTRWEKAGTAYAAWCRKVGVSPGSAPASEEAESICDRTLRHEMFLLATHYWEARWLLEMDAFLAAGDSYKKSPRKVLQRLRHMAMLAPCMVSTFYMAPSTLLAGAFKDGVWEDIPLFEGLDLLIVDEAGQALPDVSASTFALAKRALVVGDTDQIEPIWTLSPSVDRANLKAAGLFGDEATYDGQWLASGLLASSGNLMRVAQRRSPDHPFPELPRGLFLTEHRRCVPPIIDYCNELVYRGVLEPKRGFPDIHPPFPHMGMVPVVSPSKSYGGSRGNPGEAVAIAEWLHANAEKLSAWFVASDPSLRGKPQGELLASSVGIITPFAKQARLIRSELETRGHHGITVGTVHSLQGAERSLVILSSAYGINDLKAAKFYDAGVNMLNVAVSRARDMFIVFGHPDVFGKDAEGTPSALLRKRLRMIEDRQPDTASPQDSDISDIADLEENPPPSDFDDLPDMDLGDFLLEDE